MFNHEIYVHEAHLGETIVALQKLLLNDLFYIMHYTIHDIPELPSFAWKIKIDAEYYTDYLKLKCCVKNGRIVLKKYSFFNLLGKQIRNPKSKYRTDVHNHIGKENVSLVFKLLLSMKKEWHHIQKKSISTDELIFDTIKNMIILYMSNDNKKTQDLDKARERSIDAISVRYAFENNDIELLNCLYLKGLIMNDDKLLQWCLDCGHITWYAQTFGNTAVYDTPEEDLIL